MRGEKKLEDSFIVTLANLICIVFCSIFLAICLKKILSGKLNVLYILYIGLFVFYVVPLVLDVFIGKPDYSYYYSNFNGFLGLSEAIRNPVTNILYVLFIMLSTLFLFVFGNDKDFTTDDFEKKLKNWNSIWLSSLLSIMILLPMLFAIFKLGATGGNFSDLFSYNELRVLFRIKNSNSFLLYYYLALFSVVSFVLRSILIDSNTIKELFIFALPLFVSFGIHGKRNIIAIFAFLLLFSVIIRGKVKPSNIKYLLIFTAGLMLIVSVVYQYTIRGVGKEGDFFRVYTNFRLDYGRDHVLKLALYYRVKDMDIIFDGSNTLLYIPKKIISLFMDIQTGQKYSVYATSRAMRELSGYNLGWGLTTGIYDEFVSNFGILLGGFFANIAICLVGYIGDKSNNMFVLLLSYAIGFLLLVLQLVSFVYIFIPWMILVIVHFLSRRKGEENEIKYWIKT